MAADRLELIRLIQRERCAPRADAVKLGAGGETDIYLDIKGLLTNRNRMQTAAKALLYHMYQNGYLAWDGAPTAIGGPTMGADVLSHAAVLNTTRSLRWFSVRSRPKITHGLGKWIEGAELGPRDHVILTDDVVNSGDSLAEAYEVVVERTGANILAVMPLVDRGDSAASRFPCAYLPVITYADLEIQPLSA
jgi:orotate phosphoribosyltransferase